MVNDEVRQDHIKLPILKCQCRQGSDTEFHSRD
jgi:hypothetical protein